MKKSYLLIMLSFLCFTSIASDSTSRFQVLVFPYMNSDIGKGYSIAGQYRTTEKLSVNIGVKLHQNFILYYPKINNEKFHHRFYANNLTERIGLTAGLKYALPWKNNLIQPYAYYDLTVFNMDCRYQYLPDTGANTDNPIPMYNMIYKNLFSFENSAGIGVTSRIFKRLYLNVRAGGSANFIFNLPESEYKAGIYINPSYQYAIGLQYNL